MTAVASVATVENVEIPVLEVPADLVHQEIAVVVPIATCVQDQNVAAHQLATSVLVIARLLVRPQGAEIHVLILASQHLDVSKELKIRHARNANRFAQMIVAKMPIAQDPVVLGHVTTYVKLQRPCQLANQLLAASLKNPLILVCLIARKRVLQRIRSAQ